MESHLHKERVDDGVMNMMTPKLEVVPSSSTSYKARCCELVLRTLGLASTFVAALVAGVNEDTQTVPVTVASTLPALNVSVTAKWYYMSSTVYFVIANSIACAYSAASLLVHLIMSKSGEKHSSIILVMLDLAMVALLFSANGAMAAVGLIATNGNSHVMWHRVCHIFKKYCDHGTASLVVSMLASFAFLWLVVLATLTFHKKPRHNY